MRRWILKSNSQSRLQDKGTKAYILTHIARAFGWYGKRIEEATEITGALREALDSGEPAVVEVMIDKEATAPVTYYESVVERTV